MCVRTWCVHVCVHTLDLFVCCVAVENSPHFSCEDEHRIEELLKEASRFDSKHAWDYLNNCLQ